MYEIQCAEYLCSRQWGALSFPAPFGRDALPEEKYIAELDAKSGSSLKSGIPYLAYISQDTQNFNGTYRGEK